MNGMKHLALSLIVFAAAATALAAAAGPKVTIIGDSYSTFAGTMPQGYDNYYTGANCGIASAADTWWAQVIAALDGKLEVNNSWSGSLISTKAHGSTKPFVSEDRLSNLGNPDVIFIFGGTNDAWDKVPLGEDVANPYDAAAWTAGNLAKLRPATAYLIHELKTRHPDARLFMIINSTDDVDGTSRVGIEASYANALAEIAAHESVPVVRLAGISKTSEHPNAAGMAAIAAQVLAVYNAPVDPDPADDDDEGEIVQIEGASPVEPLEVDGNLVYVLTDVSQGYTITVTKETKLLQALVVGGGGSGGWTIGGGGGGGQVLELDHSLEDALAAGTVLTVQVGAGGLPVSGAPCDGNGAPWKALGGNGGNSTLTIGGTTYTALGGGAGAAFFSTKGASGASGGGGAGSGGTGGAATAGYAGGNVGKGSGTNDHCAGGGGGATAAGENGMTINQYSGRGGEGKAISLTGVSQVYGSGGGGGGGNGVSAAVGGTNGGAGGASGQTGGNGVDGFGGGGGGGSYDVQANLGYSGGRGGNGAVILVFEAPQVEEVADSLAITGSPSELGAVSPNYGVLSNLVAGSVTTLSAQPFILEGGTMTICEGYQLFTVENGRWALKAESAETTCEYAHVAGQQAKLVWRWRVATADDSRLGVGRAITDVTLVGNSATVTFESGVVTDKLYLLAGGAPGGLGTNGWEIVTLVDGAVDPSATSATVMLPEGWGDSVRAMRFAFNVDLGEPLEVERLGSITSPGDANNYVNALYVHKGNTRIDAVIDVPASQPRGPWCCVLGSRNQWASYNTLCFYATSQKANGYPVLNRVGEETVSSTGFAFDTPVRLVIDGLTAAWQDPETDEVKGSVTQTGTVLSGLCSLFIFNGNDAKAADGIVIEGAGIKMTLYSFRIFEGDRLVRDFVPAKDGDGRLGLWDCVESVFSPALEGTFTSEIGRQTTVSKTVFAPLAPTAQPEDSLKIVGTPEDLGTVAPNYGLLTDLADGEVVELSAPAYFKTDTTVVSCSGYRLWQANGSTWTLVREAAKRRLSYHHVAGARAQLEWVWETAETDDADCGTGRTITAVTIEGKQVTVTFAAGTATDRLYLMTGSMPGGVGTNGWESIVCVNEAVGPSETSATFDLPREWGRKVRALRFGFNVELGEPLPGLRCASLDSPGTANSGYFPTGYTHSPSTRIDALINVASNQPRGNSGTWCCVLGARNQWPDKNPLCFYATSGKANSYPVLNRVGVETVSSTGFTFDTPVRLVIDGLTATWRDPDTDEVKGSVSQTGTASDGFCQLILFDGNHATAADGIVRGEACTKMSLYAFKIYTGSKLERDYIPMRQNDAPGLWDRVSKTFTAAAVPSGGDALAAVPLERQVTFSSTLLAEPSPRRGMILKFR